MKTCPLCTEQIKPSYRLCNTCYSIYNTYIKSQWFLELEKLQAQQDKIDKIEYYSFKNYMEPSIYGRNNLGRPQTDWRIVNKVLEIYDSNPKLSLRQIEKRMSNTISYQTIRKILLKYRTVK